MIRNSMTFESKCFPFQMCLPNSDRKDWERIRIEGIGSETYHFEENNNEARSDKYRGQQNEEKNKTENETNGKRRKAQTKLNKQHTESEYIQGR